MSEVKNNEPKYDVKKILLCIIIFLCTFYAGCLFGQYGRTATVFNRAASVIDGASGNLDRAVDALRQSNSELEKIRTEVSGAGTDVKNATREVTEIRETISSNVGTAERIRANNKRAEQIVKELIGGNKSGKSSSKETDD